MKTTLYFILLAFAMLTFVPNSLAQADSTEYVVRTIYFLPKDRQSQPDIDTQLDTLMKEAQQFYVDVMECYGFDRKTFQLETDASGKVVVHHVKGKFNDTYYHNRTFGKALDELSPNFDTSKNIYFVAIDISSEKFDVNLPSSHICGQSSGKWAATPASGICFNYRVIAHELGHNFGLSHDKLNHTTMGDRMVDSFCTAEWLDVHPYLNEGTQTDFNEPTTVNMLDPSRGPSSNAVRFSFQVRDADGLHQAQLYIPAVDSIVGCKRLSGESTTVEFDTTYLVSQTNSIWLKVIDVNGNHTNHRFSVDISNFLLPPKKVTIPDANLAAAIRLYTDLPPNAEITTETMVRLTRLTPGLDFLSDDPITNLTGLEHAINLSSLSLYYPKYHPNYPEITGFSALSRLRELRYLEIPGAGISDISILSALTKLKGLDLHLNTIQDISVLAGLTNLKSLSLGANNISNITPLAGLTNLTYLRLNSNQISDISPIAELTNLNALYLGGNDIKDITALGGLTNLTTWLGLEVNQITDVSPLVNLVNLRKLRLRGNPIQDFSPLRILLANNPDLEIDIDIPDPSPLVFSPGTIADQTFTVGEAVNLTLPVATGGTPPYTYTLAPLPTGLFFNTTERVLSGTPTTEGTTTATYTTTDAANVSTSLTFTIEVITGVILDVNGDGLVTVVDLAIVALFYGTQVPVDISLPADVNADGIVDILDLTAVAQGIDAAGENQISVEEVAQAVLIAAEQAAELEAAAGAPMRIRSPRTAAFLSVRLAAKNVADALATTRADVRLQKGFVLLEELLTLLTEMLAAPETTVLLPNYPNPFNPETWIPYHLAKDADVTLRIYGVDGTLVRTLPLGYQPAGMYQNRSRAAYWDGRNEFGEKGASGLYFYTLTAGDFSATRKLLIRK